MLQLHRNSAFFYTNVFFLLAAWYFLLLLSSSILVILNSVALSYMKGKANDDKAQIDEQDPNKNSITGTLNMDNSNHNPNTTEDELSSVEENRKKKTGLLRKITSPIHIFNFASLLVCLAITLQAHLGFYSVSLENTCDSHH